ncbi:MAG: hypothetical protein ACR2P7_03430 [bacterium]
MIAPRAPTLAAQAPVLLPKLTRVRNLVRANVLGLAREILETQGPPPRANDEWLAWERQLWAVYRAQRQWRRLHARVASIPPSFPAAIRREAARQAIDALNALQQGAPARALIRDQLLAADASADADNAHHLRHLREALIESYLNDNLLADARIALERFRADYGARGIKWPLLAAGVLLQSGDADAAINLLAPLDQPAAKLLRLYARLRNQTLTPLLAADRARGLLPTEADETTDETVNKKANNKPNETPAAMALRRDIHAVIAQAQREAGAPQAFAEALESYLSATELESESTSSPTARDIYPRFTSQDLLDAYRVIAQHEANRAGLLVGDESQWLIHATGLPDDDAITRRSLFAHVAYVAHRAAPDAQSALRRRASDAYVGALIAAERAVWIARMFGADAPLGELVLGGEVGLRLAAHAVARGDYAAAADANARMVALPPTLARADWLLPAARIDILAGDYQRGAARLNQWIESFERFTPAQTDAVLQVIFDLQTAARHRLALVLLHKIDARAPRGKHRREIAYWLAESYHAEAQHRVAADWFLHSALQRADGFDRWGEAARYRAAESLQHANLFAAARRLFEDMLARADSDARRNAVQQKLQTLHLLEAASASPPANE